MERNLFWRQNWNKPFVPGMELHQVIFGHVDICQYLFCAALRNTKFTIWSRETHPRFPRDVKEKIKQVVMVARYKLPAKTFTKEVLAIILKYYASTTLPIRQLTSEPSVIYKKTQ